jgi:ribosomal protein L7Ae-like RNA K-turn-binding protein
MNEVEPIYIDPLTRLKNERELKKAQKKARKTAEVKVGKKAAARLVKNATKKVMAAESFDKRVAKHTARGG